jgi:hypothetical protein
VLLVGLIVYRRIDYKPIQYLGGFLATAGILAYNIIEAREKKSSAD